jgi:hypothetical protein
MREPGLRARARAQLARRLRGEPAAAGDSAALGRYALYGLAWSVMAVCLAAVMSLRYVHALSGLLPAPVVWAMVALLWASLCVPILAWVGRPLLDRFRRRRSG